MTKIAPLATRQLLELRNNADGRNDLQTLRDCDRALRCAALSQRRAVRAIVVALELA